MRYIGLSRKKISFILCGSSARKLKRGAANLLGGRAWRFNFYPLVYKEIPDFNLLRALNHGLLPSHYLSDHPQRAFKEYYQILVDTWIGYFVYPFSEKMKRDLIYATPRFYLFDVGVGNYLTN